MLSQQPPQGSGSTPPTGVHLYARRPLAWRIHAGPGSPCLTAIAYGRTDAERVAQAAFGPTAPIQTTLRRAVTPVRYQEATMSHIPPRDLPHASLLDLRTHRVTEQPMQASAPPAALITEQHLEDEHQRGFVVGYAEGERAGKFRQQIDSIVEHFQWFTCGIAAGFVAASLLYAAFPRLLSSGGL